MDVSWPSGAAQPNFGSAPTLGPVGDPSADEERAALLALLEERPALAGERAGKTSWSTIASEVTLRGSALALWHDLHPPTLDGMAEPGLQRAGQQLAQWTDPASGFDLVTVLDAQYPTWLRGIHQMPPLLFVAGELRAEERGVSVVGSRDATGRGRALAAQIAEGLTERGIAVISGLAAGIDGAAHEATLRAGGRPIGVLGTGITRVYPASHRELHEQVAAAGALVSQFLPDAPPTKQSFPMRNVTMSGLGRASVIVEAGEHSGTRIQARAGVEHGRPVILTDLVVKATTWGKAMRERPGVYVAGSTAEVMDIVEGILDDHDSDDLDVAAPAAGRPSRR
ncbi:DNA-processing protein DprA [Mycobacterium simiae]|uniref:DNA-processing protein DprA n=1 Tax=Mycobacterium simiae TaxID=1784 RepID=A0A5B1BTG8_MYCSI|nr:DNA-processing protein DprA [Mycobacterium simiae]KAA1250750.1 DNA-processing protein DprA [Mycobacterium simiae]